MESLVPSLLFLILSPFLILFFESLFRFCLSKEKTVKSFFYHFCSLYHDIFSLFVFYRTNKIMKKSIMKITNEIRNEDEDINTKEKIQEKQILTIKSDDHIKKLDSSQRPFLFCLALLFSLLSGFLLFMGQNLLLCFFAFFLGELSLCFATFGKQDLASSRLSLLSFIATPAFSLPIFLFAIIGLYKIHASFHFYSIVSLNSFTSLIYLPVIFLSLYFFAFLKIFYDVKILENLKDLTDPSKILFIFTGYFQTGVLISFIYLFLSDKIGGLIITGFILLSLVFVRTKIEIKLKAKDEILENASWIRIKKLGRALIFLSTLNIICLFFLNQ